MLRFVVVLPLEPLWAGETFAVSEWPLHITVVPPFDTEAGADELASALEAACDGEDIIHAVAGPDALFGRRHDIPVTLVQRDEELDRVQQRLTAAIRPLAARPDDVMFTGRTFRPHVTVKGDRRVDHGDALRLAQVALVDMAPRSSPGGRAVIAVTALGEAPAGG